MPPVCSRPANNSRNRGNIILPPCRPSPKWLIRRTASSRAPQILAWSISIGSAVALLAGRTRPCRTREHQPSHKSHLIPSRPLSPRPRNRSGIPASWIRAVMQAESGGDVRAVSPKGAMGLMQIMPETWATLRLRYGLGADPFDPHDNISQARRIFGNSMTATGRPAFSRPTMQDRRATKTISRQANRSRPRREPTSRCLPR